MDARPQAHKDEFFTSSDGLKLHYRDYGDRLAKTVPVICLPGLTRNARDFETLAEKLAEKRRVICFELRGRGDSQYDENMSNYQPPVYVADVLALMAAANIHKAVFIGTSLGGILTMALGPTRPGAIAGAILNDIGPELDPRGLARIAGYVGKLAPPASWDEAVNQLKTANEGVYPDFTDEDWMLMARRTFNEDGSGNPAPAYDPKIGDAMRKGGGAGDLWPAFKSLGQIPTLAIRGGVSDLLSDEILQKMVSAHPKLETLTVPNVGHVPLLEREPSFSAINAFLAARDAETSH